MTIEAHAQRKILFRGKTVCKNEWCFGYYVNFDEVDYIFLLDTGDGCDGSNGSAEIELCPVNSMIEVIPETVGQYTGLNDKNGVKIFEKDYIRWNHHRGVVKISLGAAGVRINPQDFMALESVWKVGDGRKVEKLGNIIDNPELSDQNCQSWGKMKYIITARELNEMGKWEKYCDMTGMFYYAMAEGMDPLTEFTLTESQYKELEVEG